MTPLQLSDLELDTCRIKPTWIIMPILAHRDYTVAAIADCLAQSVPKRLLLINQGVDDDFRRLLERTAEEYQDCVFVWSHMPPLPSLAATWNRALDFVWEVGGSEALVVNNDVRLHQSTVHFLKLALQQTQALFVTAVGRATEEETLGWSVMPDDIAASRGGPDFSCYLISQECHAHFRFDENFAPAYCEDLDYHRRLLLAGEGARIFSVNLPYLHYGAGTLKAVDQKTKARIEQRIAMGSRAYYAKKWGGPVNEERFVLPFRQTEDRDVSTPALQAMVREDRSHLLPRVDAAWLMQQGNYNPVDRVGGL